MLFMWCGQLRKYLVCMRPALKFIIIIIIIRHELGFHRHISAPTNSIHKTKNKRTYNYMHDFTSLFFSNHEQFKHTYDNKEN